MIELPKTIEIDGVKFHITEADMRIDFISTADGTAAPVTVTMNLRLVAPVSAFQSAAPDSHIATAFRRRIDLGDNT